MSGLIFLQTEDWHIENSSKQDGSLLLCNSIKGISFVLFYSQKCPHSQNLLPIFKRLPGQVGGVIFSICLINSQIIKASKSTIDPISYVPLMILYVNGRPFVKYELSYDEHTIKKFVLDIGNKIQLMDKFDARKRPSAPRMAGAPHSASDSKEQEYIPPYSLGLPVSENVSYIEFNEYDDSFKMSAKRTNA